MKHNRQPVEKNYNQASHSRPLQEELLSQQLSLQTVNAHPFAGS
jgi:hypothetical protein